MRGVYKKKLDLSIFAQIGRFISTVHQCSYPNHPSPDSTEPIKRKSISKQYHPLAKQNNEKEISEILTMHRFVAPAPALY